MIDIVKNTRLSPNLPFLERSFLRTSWRTWMPITPNYFKRKSGVAQGAALFLFGTAFSFSNLSAIIPLGMGNFSLCDEKNFPGQRSGVFARFILLCGIVSNPEIFFKSDIGRYQAVG